MAEDKTQALGIAGAVWAEAVAAVPKYRSKGIIQEWKSLGLALKGELGGARGRNSL